MPSPVISIAQMRQWEQATWASGQKEAEVIRQVGQCVATRALNLTQPGDLVLILAGKGHNGDDVRCAGQYLADRSVELLSVTDPASDLSKLDTLLALRPALIIDGLFGIGLNRALGPEWVRFIERINAACARILSVDLPSGLNADTGEPQGTAIRATITLTVGAPKSGMLKEAAWPFVGHLDVTPDVGLLPCPQVSGINWTLPDDFIGYPPDRMAATHKGTCGHLVIIAGSRGYHGAAVLAARAAQRARPGLITLRTLESVYLPIASQLQAVMVSPWEPALGFPDSCTAILVGPGLAGADVPEDLKALTRSLWHNSNLPVVMDASALDWLHPGPVATNAVRVITPHPGEAARLLRTTSQQIQANRLASLRDLSTRFGSSWVVLKGHQTVIGQTSGDLFVNSSGNPHLAQGGSGDVLAGYLAGLLAQPQLEADPVKTIRFAVWEHGATADWLQASGRNWVVEDLVAGLGYQQPAIVAKRACTRPE
jgi:ADP-dependent NAD(P)H-hydrate dehydratase / NAD(P)H-hydrate epimerase